VCILEPIFPYLLSWLSTNYLPINFRVTLVYLILERPIISLRHFSQSAALTDGVNDMPLLDLLALTNDDVGTIAFFNVRGVLHDSTPSQDYTRNWGRACTSKNACSPR